MHPTKFRLTLRAALLALTIALLGLSGVATGQEDDSFVAELDGRKTWTIQFGVGSALGLASAGVTAGSITLDQTLAVDLRAEALTILTVEAHFDDRQSDSLQSLAVYLDTERLDGVFGDFTIEGLAGFNAQRRKAIGGRLEYFMGAATLTGVAALFEGITETKTFVGATAEGETIFSAVEPDQPWVEQPYTRGIDGLFAYPLEGLYVEEISTVRLEIPGGASSVTVLASFGMEYIAEILTEEPETDIEASSFVVIGDEAQVLLLTDRPQELVAERIEDAIDEYNDKYDDDREYPFVEGSAYEEAFLGALADVTSLLVDEQREPLLEGIRRRYYDLGRTGISESSVSVDISEDGEHYVSIDRSGMEVYEATVHTDDGILEIDFPESFFEGVQPAIRVGFSYVMSGGTYTLGFSLVPGSERVSINGEALSEEDYEIDYEVGLLILLVEVEEPDVILVEYERYSGGLGGASDYARYFLGLTLDLPVTESLDITATVQRGFDDSNSVTDADRVGTAPNRQTVGGVSGTVSLDDLTGDFALGYGVDVFPPGENERPTAPNEITAVAATEEYTFVGHLAGFSVLHEDTWRAYGTSEGLSGRAVYAIAADEDRVVFGTSAGLTVVELAGKVPLDRAANWETYGIYDGFTDEAARAVLLWEESLWIGTDEGLFTVPVDELEDPTAWELLTSEAVTALAVQERIYVGTGAGVYSYEPTTGTLTQIAGSASMNVRAMTAVDGLLYVASDRGLRTYADGQGAGWVAVGEEVLSVAAIEQELYYGTADGLTRVSDGALLHETWAITALGWSEAGELWVGSRADADYLLMLWREGEETFDNVDLLIDGQDATRFDPMQEDENTASGFFGRASFRHEADGLELSGDVSAVEDGYRAIGSSASSGSADWSLDAEIDLWEGAKLVLTHEYDLQDGEDGWTGDTWNRVSFSADLGPNVSATLWQAAGNDDVFLRGPETSALSFDAKISESLFADALDLSITWSRSVDTDHVDGTVDTENVVAGRAAVDLPFDLRLVADWRRPLRGIDGNWDGTERWAFDADWSGDFGFGDIDLSASADARRDIDDEGFDWTLGADGDLGVDPIEVEGWRVTPTFDGSVDWEDGETTLAGKSSLRGTWEAVTLRLTLSGDVSGIGGPVLRRNGKVSFSASSSASEIWRPSLNYSLSRSVTEKQSGGSATTTNHSLVGHLDWTGDVASNDLSLTVRVRNSASSKRLTVSVEDSYRTDVTEQLGSLLSVAEEERDPIEVAREQGMQPRPEDGEESTDAENPYPKASLRLDADVDFGLTDGEGDFDASAAAMLDVSLTEMWGGSLGFSYFTGTKSAGGLYHSFLLELTVAIDF